MQKILIAKRIVQKFSISPEDLKDIALYCKEIGIAFSSTPYCEAEVDFLVDECQAPFIKIASMEINNYDYLQYIAKKGVPVVLSTGMAEADEVRKAVKVIENAGNTSNYTSSLHFNISCGSGNYSFEQYLVA